MVRVRAVLAAVVWSVLGGVCEAQTAFATDALQHGRLVVWVVQPAPAPPPTADEVRATLHTATAGGFGQDAGSVGQTSGSYGLSPGDLPSNISSRPAGEAGVPPGSFPANQPVIAGSGVAAETPAADGAVALGQR